MNFKQFKTSIRCKFPFVAHYGDAINGIITIMLASVQRRTLKRLIRLHYSSNCDEEIRQVLAFIDHNELQMIPYEFVGKYNLNDITVISDDISGYPWVEVSGHRVYFPKEMSVEDIRRAVNSALVEQDELSPHCYKSGNVTFGNEGAAVLIGASDGIFCLSILEHFSTIYLFEADQKWLNPLTMTFAPWGDRVRIVQKFVSDRDAGNEITIDTFSATINDDITYLQADVEGAEKRMLIGGKKLLSRNKKLKLSVCCYHRRNDSEELSDILKSHGFSISYSQGYLIMWMQAPLRKPYLRRGVIYADKS